jgi:predicted RNA methylase
MLTNDQEADGQLHEEEDPVSLTYGEISQGSFQSLLDVMRRSVPMDSTSYFLDIGSGLGKPQWHAAIMTSCSAYGIEACKSRVEVAKELKKNLMIDEDFKEIGEKVFFCHSDAGRVLNFILDD